MLAERFEAAAGHEPLSGLAPADAAELAAVLRRAERFEDLPGRWQAALLSAERPAADTSPSRCCGGH